MTGNIIIPKAGTTAGRAPDIASRMHTPQTGAMIAELGDTMLKVGVALENDRLERDQRRFKLEITRDLNNLRVTTGDLDGADNLDMAWASGVGLLRQKYFEGTDDRGRANVDPRLRPDLRLYFDEVATGHAASLGARALDMRSAERIGTVEALGAELQALYLEGDDQAREFAIAQFSDAVDENQALGLYAPEVAAELKRDWLRRADAGRQGRGDDADAGPLQEISMADEIEMRLASDPDAARLARLEGFSPDSPAAVAAFADRLAALDDLAGGEREDWFQSLAQSVGRRERVKLSRPAFAASGDLTPETLRDVATKTVMAHRAGGLSNAEYRRQALLIQRYAETFDG